LRVFTDKDILSPFFAFCGYRVLQIAFYGYPFVRRAS
jgi:hypothetical protein